MRLTILGSAGSYPAPGRAGSGYLIEADGTRVWCDAGPGTFFALANHLDHHEVDAVFISHQHPDHCSDLFAVFHAWAYSPRPRRRVPLLAHPAVLDRLAGFVEADPDHAWWQVWEPRPLVGGDTTQVGSLQLEVAVADHSVPTLVSRWSDGSRVLTYSGDTGPAGDWSRLVAGCDLFLCEATYLSEADAVVYPYHLTAAAAGEIARREGAGSLVITHLPPHVEPATAVARAEEGFGRQVAVAVPGAAHRV